MHRPGNSLRSLTAVLLVSGVLGLGACGTVETDTRPAVSAASPSPSAVLPAGSGSTSGPGPDGIPIRQATPEAGEVLAQPVRLQVEGTGIDLEVVPTGVRDDGAMTIPDNHYQAGWYRYGPAPGSSNGAAVLAAHVDSQTESLPIAGLKDVLPGTRVTVTLDDGSAVLYQTSQVESIAKRSLDGHRLFDRSGSPVLKVVTCGGRWLDAESDYEDNVVLTAAPLP